MLDFLSAYGGVIMKRRDFLSVVGIVAAGGILWRSTREPDKPKRDTPKRYRPLPAKRGAPVKIWIDSPACKGRRQCRGCRTDIAFQQKLATFFVMPPGWPACPHGITADNLPPVQVDPPTQRARERVAICDACPDECRMKHGKRCERIRVAKRAGVTCPRVPSSWPPAESA